MTALATGTFRSLRSYNYRVWAAVVSLLPGALTFGLGCTLAAIAPTMGCLLPR
jgi:hypothetical protein